MGMDAGFAGGMADWGMGTLSTYQGQLWQQEQQDRQFNFNSAEGFRNRQWQEYMSSSAHQREVKDLEAAGLNPILSASRGGAPMGSGSQASAGAGGAPSVSGNWATRGMETSAMQARTGAEVELLNAQRDKTKAEEQTELHRPENLYADTEVKRGSAAKLAQDISESVSRIEKMSYEMEHLAASAEERRAATTKSRTEVEHIEQLITSVKQSNKANLPEVKRRIAEVEEILINFKKPEAFNNAALHDDYLGRLSTLLKGLSPLIR